MQKSVIPNYLVCPINDAENDYVTQGQSKKLTFFGVLGGISGGSWGLEGVIFSHFVADPLVVDSTFWGDWLVGKSKFSVISLFGRICFRIICRS